MKLIKSIAVGSILSIFMPPRIHKPHKLIDGLRWYRVFGQKMFINARYPLYGINMIEVKPENLQKVIVNFGKQIFFKLPNVYGEQIVHSGGSIYYQDKYLHGENIRVIIIVEWPKSLAPNRNSIDIIKKMHNPIKVWNEFMGLVESYNWMCTSNIAEDLSLYKELFDTNLN
ncbi:hypothetical protein AN640_00425 [Candidatus Epulonipiscium fishelsonii]|uniref:Uncharacterized protein n=1 Tax=Candidatus Epulonipiscium fishelsonii TaxID=77094 RepID=A0ACC8XA33_9FIRM|nr:hypothetical protein AN640_00425 [Epulopiscium sp. SCG-D08WGA-EpuloA1]OON97564.1 MAG: hypothetical protein ATN32_05430 [Epulopiscium sp. AS2M-Bin002]